MRVVTVCLFVYLFVFFADCKRACIPFITLLVLVLMCGFFFLVSTTPFFCVLFVLPHVAHATFFFFNHLPNDPPFLFNPALSIIPYAHQRFLSFCIAFRHASGKPPCGGQIFERILVLSDACPEGMYNKTALSGPSR